MRLILSTSLLCFLFGCEAQQKSSIKTQSEFSSAAEQVSYLGAGFDSSRQQVHSNECMGTAGAPIVTDDTLDTASAKIVADQTAAGLHEFLYGYGKIGIPVYPAINLTIEADLTRDHVTNKFSEVMTIAYRAGGLEESLDPNGLSIGSDARRVLTRLQKSSLSEAEKAAIFDKACGDQFVLKVERGIVFLASIRMKFDSEYSMNELKGALSVELGNIAQPLAPLNKLVKIPKFELGGRTRDVYEHVTLEVVVYQRGGAPEDALLTLNGGDSDQAQKLLTCNFDHREQCYNAFLDLQKYASEELPKQLSARKNLAPLNYIAEQYYDAGIAAMLRNLPVKPDPSGVKEILTRIRNAESVLNDDAVQIKETELALPALYMELIDQYEGKNLEVDDLLQNLGINWVQNQILRQKISKAKDSIAQQLALYTDIESECLRTLDLKTCNSDLQALENRVKTGDLAYDRQSIQLPPKSFPIYCQLSAQPGALNEADQATVEAIMEAIKTTYESYWDKYHSKYDLRKFLARDQWLNPSNGFEVAAVCKSVQIYLNSVKELDLSNKGISSLDPIRGLDKLTKLKLGGNSLDNGELLKLALLPNLKELDLSSNFFTDLTPLASLNAETPEILLPLADELPAEETDLDADPQLQKGAIKSVSCEQRLLVLDRNKIDSLDSLASSSWAWGRLSLKRNAVAKIPGIVVSSCLKSLDLERNPVKEVSADFKWPEAGFELILKGTAGASCPIGDLTCTK